jgi:1-deoxy-D-xylulose-5-phosphate synthase
MQVAQALDLSVVDMRFVKPIDADLVREMASTHEAVVTLEEGCVMGGAGSAVAETLNQSGQSCPLLQLGLPDLFIDHGEQGALLVGAGLDAAGIERSIRKRFYP